MKYLIKTILITLTLLPIFVFADITYTPLISDLPGLTPNTPVDLGTYLGVLYKILIGVTIALAVIVITFAGIQNMTSESPFNKSEAKRRIGEAIGGIILALTSFLILYTINPCLVSFKFLNPSSTECGGPITKTTNDSTTPQPLSVFFPSEINLAIGAFADVDQQIGDVSGGTKPYTFSMGGLPPGITGNSSGSISGSVTEVGTYEVFITVTDGKGEVVSGRVVFNIRNDTSIRFVEGERVNKTTNKDIPFSYTARVFDGVPPYVFRLIGTLPQGLNFDPDSGTISGTPTTVGNFSFVIKVNDSRTIEENTFQSNELDQNINLIVRLGQFCFDGIRNSGGNIGQTGTVCADTLVQCENLRATDTSLENKSVCSSR